MPLIARNAPIGDEDYDESSAAIKRRRLLSEKLMEPAPGAHGWGGVGAALLRNISQGYEQGTLDREERDLATRRATAADEWLNKMPRDQPSQAEVNPSAPPAALETMGGGPPLPSTYTRPTEPDAGMVPQVPSYEHKDETPFLPASLNQVAPWAMKGAKFGPAYAAIGTHAMNKAIDTPIEQEKQRVAIAAATAEKEAQRAATANQNELARIGRAQENEYNRAERARLATEAAANRRADQEARAADQENLRTTLLAMKGDTAAAKGAGVKAKFEGYDNDGNRVFTRPDGVSVTLQPEKDEKGKQVLDEKGQPKMEHVVHAGEITPAASAEKAAAKVYSLNASIKQSEAALQQVRDNPDAFGFKSWITPQGKTGLIAKAAGIVTPEQLKAQTTVFRQQADIVHSIYGAALTRGEDVAKASWAPLPGESDVLVAKKLEAAIEYARRQVESAPRTARAIAERRSAGDTKPSIRNM